MNFGNLLCILLVLLFLFIVIGVPIIVGVKAAQKHNQGVADRQAQVAAAIKKKQEGRKK